MKLKILIFEKMTKNSIFEACDAANLYKSLFTGSAMINKVKTFYMFSDLMK